MSQQPLKQDKQSTDLDTTLDSLLAKQIDPSADFTDRVLAEIRDTKVVQGPWQQAKHWIGGALTAAAAIAIAIGFNHANNPQAGETELFIEDASFEANPFLDSEGEFVDEAPYQAIDSLLENTESHPNIDALLDEQMLLDLNMLLES